MEKLSNKEILNNLVATTKNDIERFEKYTKKYGYNIDLKEPMKEDLEQKIKTLFPVTNFLHQNGEIYYDIDFIDGVSSELLFAVNNPEIYMVNKFFATIGEIHNNFKSIEITRCGIYFENLLTVFSLVPLYKTEINNNTRKVQIGRKSKNEHLLNTCIYFFDQKTFDEVLRILNFTNDSTITLVSAINSCDKTRETYKSLYKVENKDIPYIVSNCTLINNIGYSGINYYLIEKILS